jgi:hypothetical protein
VKFIGSEDVSEVHCGCLYRRYWGALDEIKYGAVIDIVDVKRMLEKD